MTSNVRFAEESEWEECLQLLCADIGDLELRQKRVRQYLLDAESGRASLNGMVCSAGKSGVNGALMTVPVPGEIVQVFEARTRDRSEEDTTRMLRFARESWLARDCPGRLVQAIVRHHDSLWGRSLIAAGFASLGEIELMSLELPNGLDSHMPDPPIDRISFEQLGSDAETRFLAIVERTYELSLDCPELIQLRSTRQALESHRSVGRFRPDWWYLICVDGEDVAVVLSNEIQAEHSAEIVYLGVAQGYRRQQIGSNLVRLAIRDSQLAGMSELAVGVDRRNHPAREMYVRHGFQLRHVRSVYGAHQATRR